MDNLGTCTKQVAIYALCCPKDGGVKYIGKAVDPEKRHKGHLRERRGNTPKVNWIQKCLKNGLAPSMVVLEWVGLDEWMTAEKRWISHYRSAGPLLNVADGGDEPHCPTKVRAKNGKSVAQKVHSDPIKRRLWELKRMLGSALKDGVLSDRAKAKMRKAAERYPQFYGDWAAI